MRLAGIIGVAWLTACGAAQPAPTTPQREELVVDEATVVSVRRPLREGELPPLPQALPATSTAFQRGHALAIELLRAPGPGAPAALDAATYDAWSAREFQSWLAARVTAAQLAADALGAVRAGPASEHVPAAALLGLCFARTHAQLLAVPPPASVSADPKLLRVYQAELNDGAQRWSEQAAAAFAHCGRGAAREREPAFGLWLELCLQQVAALQQTNERARLLAAAVAAEREADRLAAEGPRPEGPQICWGGEPVAAQPAPVPAATAVPAAPAAAAVDGGASAAAVAGATTSAVSDASASPNASAPNASATPNAGAAPKRTGCARAAHTVADDAAGALTPRDQRYGARDPASGVRVWAALGDNPTMDATPLLEPQIRAALAACFARGVPASRAITVAVHATLSVDARGATRSATLTPEPSDAAAPPDAKLSQCLQRALQRVAFTCSPSGQATQASATFCLRRD